MQTLDLSSVPDEAIEELHRQAEICLQGTVDLAIAADSRATALSAIFGGGFVALLAAVAAILQSNPGGQFSDIILLGTFASICLFAGSIICAMAGKPSDFFIAGYEPRLLAPSAQNRIWMLRYVTEDIQVRIDANRKRLEHSAWLLKIGLFVAIFGVITSAATLAFISSRPEVSF